MLSIFSHILPALLLCLTQMPFSLQQPVGPPPANNQPASAVELSTQLDALQQQLQKIQQQLLGNPPPAAEPVDDLFNKPKQFNRRQVFFQPMRRMVSWQPMRKAAVPNDSRDQVMKAIEDQLTETLRAGEQLGISANNILSHLRQRNMMLYQPFA